MSKVFIILFTLVTLTLSHCFGQQCTYQSPQTYILDPKISDIVPLVDQQIRRVYWYYLQNANVLYQANVDGPKAFIMFFIYRNIVGTFLTIGSWQKDNGKSEINTMVRLGNGHSSQLKTNYSPFNINPFVLSLKIGQEENIVEFDEGGNLRVDGQVATILNSGESGHGAVCEKDIDNYLRQKYWYFIQGADLVNEESIITNVRHYSVLTYVNIAGTFLVIVRCEGSGIEVNTLVRLGSGGRPQTIVDPIKMMK